MSGAEPFLKAETLTKSFGNIRALDEVSVEVFPNELLVVLGPTGAGKTTLLRTICGLDAPDAGAIRVGGEDVTQMSPAQRDMAMVFQNFSLYPRWTVRKNMEFPLRAPGMNVAEEEIQKRISWAADILKITRLLDRQSTRLSGGEMQRVAIGRAIVRQPKIYLMDEPLTNLDAKLRESLRVELVELRRRVERPMIFVTHDQAEALSMADRIVVLSEGKVLQVGSPDEVYNRPASPTVALQLGQPKINLVSAAMRDGWWFSDSGTPLAPVAEGHPNNGASVTVGIRPEHITPDGGNEDYPGSIKVVEYMGPTTTLVVDWCGEDFHVSVDGVSPLKPGDKVLPSVDPTGVLLWPQG